MKKGKYANVFYRYLLLFNSDYLICSEITERVSGDPLKGRVQ